MNTLVIYFMQEGYRANTFAGIIEVEKATEAEIIFLIKKCVADGLPSEEILAKSVQEKRIEKFDCFLPETLLCLNYGKKYFDCAGARECLENLLKIY